MADATADIGVACHGEGMIHLAEMYCKRHAFYVAKMTQFVTHIIEAHLIHRELIRIKEIKDEESRGDEHGKWKFSPMKYGSTSQFRKLVTHSNIKRYPRACKLSLCIEEIENFIRNLNIIEGEPNGRSLTWIELYILYRCTGNKRPLDNKQQDSVSKLKQAIPVNLQINHFKAQVRIIADRTMSGSVDEDKFKPACILDENLLNVGIKGKHAAVRLNISLNEETQQIVNKALILLGKHMSDKKLAQIIDQDRSNSNHLCPLNLKGKVGWDNRLSTYLGSLNPAKDDKGGEVLKPDDCVETARTRIMFIVQCPSCNNQISCQKYNFHTNDLDQKIKCSECLKHCPSRKWKCNCGVPWHTCKVHFCAEKVKPSRDNVSQSTSSHISGKATSKRLLPNASIDEILDDDLRTEAKRAKRFEAESKVDSLAVHGSSHQIEASMQSGRFPKLRERFAHLFSR
jgi:hypothetical protein